MALIAQGNLDGQFTATVIFRHEGDTRNPLQPEDFSGTYGEVIAFLARCQLSEYPISSASLRLL